MDKLKSLFQQAGVSETLTSAIIEEIDNHIKIIQEDYDQRFQTKLAKAEKVAQDLLNKEKIRLSKRVGVYLEAKDEHINRAAEKQRLNEDTEATSMLKRVRALLEGVNIEDPSQNQDLQVARKQIARLQRAVGTLKEERNVAVHKANDANKIAVKQLNKNRLLENKLKAVDTLNEEKPKPKAMAEGKSSKKKGTITEEKPRRRLDSRRQAPAKGKSTRPVLDASQKTSGKSSGGDRTIAGIANTMED